jgi:hypothetical protein
METNFTTLLVIFIVIVLLDKGLTAINMIQVNKNFPDAMKGDAYKIERNPAAKYFFEQFGLWKGSFIYAIISIATLFTFFFIFSWVFSDRVALYIIFIFYGFVIANNTYFLLKYSAIIT